jgi:apolipoprotein D and lipocalin family protein
MRRLWTVLLVTAGVAVPLLILRAVGNARENLQVVPAVDLNRYAGTWYEIARLPNRFQRQCAGDVTATYRLRDNGKVEVINECRREDGVLEVATGTAWQPDPPEGRLKVRFFWPFTGDYWIMDLDPDYRWALVGEPGRDNLWVLSREPQMDEAQLARILETAARQGYDLDNLIRTRHAR